MSIPEDPYFAGRILDKSGEPTGSHGLPPLIAWSCVYAVNLIGPVYWGSMVTRDGGRVGMLIGIIVVFVLGWRVCYVSRSTVLTVVYGGWIVAASQFLPILHLFAGGIGIAAAEPMSGGDGNLNTVLGGFIATLVTGCILIALAAAFGVIIQGIRFLFYEGTHAWSMARRLSKEKYPSFDMGPLACAYSDSASRSEP